MQYAFGREATIEEELTRAVLAVRNLQSAVLGLRARLGSNIDVERLADDAERCTADLSRLEQHTLSRRTALPRQEFIVIPDGEYDPGFWADGDVDGEGLGVPGRRAP